MIPSNILRVKLLEILKVNHPRNTCQICRMVRGSHAYHIELCRGKKGRPIKEFRKDSYWTEGGLYPNCKDCTPNYFAVWRALWVLKRKGFVDTRKEYRSDPIKPNAKDNVRMWALKGKLPSMDHFVEPKTMMRGE